MEKLASGFDLVEGPAWDDKTSSLLVTDSRGSGVHRLLDDGSLEVVVPHRKSVNGLVLHVDGGVVISGRNVAWKRGDETVVLLERPSEIFGFNDLGSDAEGRVYAGTIDFANIRVEGAALQRGELYLIDVDGSTRVVADDIGFANGIAVSPDGRSLYVADTVDNSLLAFDRAPDGSLSNRRTVIEWPDAVAPRAVDRGPDGIAVAADGAVWVAMYGMGYLSLVAPDGTELQRVDTMPEHSPTSVCFGRSDLRTLFVTTSGGSQGIPPGGGAIYSMPVETAGFPVPLARTPTSAP
jgi:gluconolactonase